MNNRCFPNALSTFLIKVIYSTCYIFSFHALIKNFAAYLLCATYWGCCGDAGDSFLVGAQTEVGNSKQADTDIIFVSLKFS